MPRRTPFAMPTLDDLTAMLRLAAPIAAVQVGMMAMGLVDTIIVGHLSAEALAAVALGNLFFVATCSFGMGALLALDPLVSQAIGAGDIPAVRLAVQRGLVVATALAVPTSLVLLASEPLMSLLRQPSGIVPTAAAYARACSPGVLAGFLFIVARQTLQAHHRVAPILSVIVVANVANAVLDWILVYGRLGMPTLGPVGSAWASTACRWLMAGGLLVVARDELGPLLRQLDPAARNVRSLWAIVRLGTPIGVQFQLEFAAFGVIALLMGWLGTVAMAAHQVALNLAAFTFMVPLGVSHAAAVQVGRAVGAGDTATARRAASAGLLVGSGFMACTAVALLALPRPLAAVFTGAADVIAVAATLIPVAGFFQVFDGLQVVATGILRGLGDTRTPMLVNVLGFWLVGMPVSLGLGFALALGPAGLWWGLVAGLGSVAAFLVGRSAAHLRHDIARLSLAGHSEEASVP